MRELIEKKQSVLDHALLIKLLTYDRSSGLFTWNINRRGGAKAGQIAGTQAADGYRLIGINGKYYLAHRLAWLYVYGKWPENQLDHINGGRDDNRIVNLREATCSENQQNRALNCANKSGHPGVCWHSRDKKWAVQVQLKRKTYHIGNYDVLADAVLARTEAKKKLHAFQGVDRLYNKSQEDNTCGI